MPSGVYSSFSNSPYLRIFWISPAFSYGNVCLSNTFPSPVSYTHLAEKVAAWGEDVMGDEYSYIGAVVGATYPEVGKILRQVMPKSFILVPGYGAQGGKGKDCLLYTSHGSSQRRSGERAAESSGGCI